MGWTEDQQLAIDTTDKAVIVSAAAGSGKTAVLVERTINLLTDCKKQIPADKLLAVTFTNDAASQMKEKLSIALTKKIEEDPSNYWLQSQQIKLEMARISTINSFCLDLVRNNISNFDISGAIRILDDTEANIMLEKAINETMEHFYTENPETMKKLNDLFSVGKDDKLVDIILDLYKFSRSLPFKDSWFEKALSNFDDDSKEQEKWFEILYKEIKNIFYSAKKDFNECLKLAGKLQFYTEIKDTINSDSVIFKILEERINNRELTLAIDYIKKTEYVRMPPKSKKNVPSNARIENEIREKISELRKKYKEILKNIPKSIPYSKEEISNDMKLSKEVLSNLIEIVNKLYDNIWEQKVEKNAVDFSDVELMSIQLLIKETHNGYEKTELAKSISDGDTYKIILIDEFQDVNNLQDLIFKALSQTEDINLIGKNMFVVGDIKQSIYRFRQANPKIFLKTRKDANEDKNKNLITEIKLKKNFRSRKGVLDFVNFIFENIMTEEMGQVDYNEDEALDCGATYSERNPEPETEIIVIENNNDIKEKANDTNDEDEDNTNDNIEALTVAKRIKQMIDEGYSVYDNGKDRPCRQNDFCILMRGKKENKIYSDALKSVGLSADSEEIEGYLKSREISILLNMLRIIDNPMNDIAFVSVLMSPIFMFTAEDIAIIKNKSSYQKLYPAFLSAIGDIEKELEVSNQRSKIKNGEEHKDKKEKVKVSLSDELTEKCKRVVDKIKELRFYSASFSLEQLIRKIYDSTDFFAVASIYDDAKQKRANLLLLLEYADSYDKNINGGISGFIRYINSIFDNDKDSLKQAKTMASNQDAVIIKTIHKSKGLEFPFVFLCKTSKQFNKKEINAKSMMLSYEKGIGFKFNNNEKFFTYTTLAFDAIKNENNIDMLSEEMRLLYVALTRAKEKIFITLNINLKQNKSGKNEVNILSEKIANSGKITPEIVMSVKNMQEWILLALLGYQKDLFLYENKIVDNSTKCNWKTDAKIQFIKANDIKLKEIEKEEKEIDEVQVDENIVKELEKYINFKYDNKLVKMQSKLSVSEVAKKDDSENYFYQIPKLD